MDYNLYLEEYLIKKYLDDHGVIPSLEYIEKEVAALKAAKPEIDKRGTFFYDFSLVRKGETSSVSKENQNRIRIFEDLKAINEIIHEEFETLDTAYIAAASATRKVTDKLRAAEARLDNLILNNQKVDNFLYGVEESFTDFEHVDFEHTTAAVSIGSVMLPQLEANIVAPSSISFRFETHSTLPIIGVEVPSPLSAIAEEDGQTWACSIHIRQQLAKAVLMIEATFSSEENISAIKLSPREVSLGGSTLLTITYSKDGLTFVNLDPALVPITSTSMRIPLGQEGIKKVRFYFTKQAGDVLVANPSTWAYYYALDSIQFEKSDTAYLLEATLIAGPYSITDAYRNDITYSKGIVTQCEIVPERTSVEWSVSENGTDWTPAIGDDNLFIIPIGHSIGPDSKLDASESNHVMDGFQDLISVNASTEVILNSYISKSHSEEVFFNNMSLTRGLPGGEDIDGVEQGWFYDEDKGVYFGTIIVKSFRRIIDFGPKEILIDGYKRSGPVDIPIGVHVVGISKGNWSPVDETLQSLESVMALDPAYPYNHKLLIDGAVYGSSYMGDKVYRGFSDRAGSVMKYVLPEVFSDETNSKNYFIYTLVESGGNYIFKVKTKKLSQDYKKELYTLRYSMYGQNNNELYVKAILRTEVSSISPVIRNFKVRVI